MIIDSLTHVTPDGKWFHTDYDASEAHLLRELDKAQIDRAVLVALADFISNEYVLEVCQRHPDRLIPGASFNPARYETPEQAVQNFRSELFQMPYSVLKLHPRFNRYDPLDPRCLAVLMELESWDKPMCIWLDSLFYFKGVSLQLPVVDTIHRLASHVPDLKLIILHAGGSWALHVAEAIRDCPNVYLDISYTVVRYANSSVWNDLRYLAETFDRRLIFGSDFPEITSTQALKEFERLTMGMDGEKQANILGRNLELILQGK